MVVMRRFAYPKMCTSAVQCKQCGSAVRAPSFSAEYLDSSRRNVSNVVDEDRFCSLYTLVPCQQLRLQSVLQVNREERTSDSKDYTK
nr:hypothetical protein BgiMline_025260 [Biomphalaria glabrata]